jgi:hypothetical protein
MFERALIRRIDGTDIDIGMIAETIFFYDKTHLLLDRGSLLGLAKALSVSDLEQLFESETVHLSYMTGNLGVVSAGLLRTHQFVEFLIGDKDKKKKKLSVPEEIDSVLRREFKDSSQATALRKLFLRHVKANRSPRDDVPKLTREDVTDADYLVRSVRAILGRLVPEYSPPATLEFSIYDTGQGYSVTTNLDYIRINELYHQRVPVQHSSITTEYLLSFLQDARADTYFAAHYSAEIVTLPVLSDLIRLKHFEFLRPRERNETQLELFKDLAIGDFPSIREVINSGERTLPEFLRLVRDAEQFRKWLHSQNPDASLLREYQAAATAKTWADKLPTKGIRFAIATGLGLAGEVVMPTGISTMAGIAIGAGDTFLLDKIVKGWRPNQFIENRMRSFVKGNDNDRS